MSQHSQQGDESGPSPGAPASVPAGAGEGGGRPLHFRSFKLRFAAQREPGRSNLSAVKPLGLPASIADAPQRVERRQASAAELSAEHRVRGVFTRGPRDEYVAPRTSAHEYVVARTS